jgi:hypothetical protein
MVAKARAEATDAALNEAMKSVGERVENAIKEATERLKGDKERLEAEIKSIRAAAKGKPDIAAIVEAMKQHLGVKKLKPDQCRAVAMALETGVRIDGKPYLPISKEEEAENEKWLMRISPVVEAIEALQQAPAADLMLPHCDPSERRIIADALDGVSAWIKNCRAELTKYKGEAI